MTKRIDTVIFSLNRAMQLEVLLKSIEKHDIGKSLNVSILYSFSTHGYQKAYAKLKNKYPQFNWLEETIYKPPKLNVDFDLFYWHNLYWWLKYKYLRKNKSNFKQKLIEILTENDGEFAMFLTDDSLFYRNIEIPDLQPNSVFGLRHGTHLVGGKYNTTETGIEWNIYENDKTTDWGYPFSVDGHIYSKEALLKITGKIIFNNPNAMEGNIACYLQEKQLFSQIKANQHSCLLGFELNRVQSVAENHHLGISQEKLNYYFLDGYHLQIQFNRAQIQYFRPEIEEINVWKKEEKIKIYSR